MKILLIGEYSALHLELRNSLRSLGHNVFLISNGDGWKNIERDLDFPWFAKGIRGFTKKIYFYLKFYNKLTGNDVVQLIDSYQISNSYHSLNLDFIIRRNKKIFLGAFGSIDPTFIRYMTELKYHPYLNYDGKIKLREYPNFSKKDFDTYRCLMNKINGVIPDYYETYFTYKVSDYKKKLATKFISMPINCENIDYKLNIIEKKIKIFHGIQKRREYFKGSDIICSALKEIKENYPERVEIIIVSNIPLKEYLKLLENSNIVIDQCYGYSQGYNALYSMALGKVTLTGNEKEIHKYYNSISPAINIIPKKEQIVKELKNLINNDELITSIGAKSRKFVEIEHNPKKIAKKYLKTWGLI